MGSALRMRRLRCFIWLFIFATWSLKLMVWSWSCPLVSSGSHLGQCWLGSRCCCDWGNLQIGAIVTVCYCVDTMSAAAYYWSFLCPINIKATQPPKLGRVGVRGPAGFEYEGLWHYCHSPVLARLLMFPQLVLHDGIAHDGSQRCQMTKFGRPYAGCPSDSTAFTILHQTQATGLHVNVRHGQAVCKVCGNQPFHSYTASLEHQ